jgi:bacillithiol biosynthesis cysteine-adding enzyme BshC
VKPVVKHLIDAYLSDTGRAFFPLNVRSQLDRARAVEQSARPISTRVLESLRAQNAQLGPSTARAEQLAKLAHGARVVVTGQQVGLFLGPLYTVYKAATAVQLARTLERETGQSVVPVFWLQTEDHDLPEIARCVVPRADAEPLVLAPEIDPNNRISIAHVPLPNGISHCIEQLGLELGRLPYAREHLARIAHHYRPGRSWGTAFAGLLADLFEPTGLLLIDPRDAALAPESAAIHRNALERARDLDRALLSQTDALRSAGFEPQVHVRGGSPLCFFHPEGPTGPRTRLVREENGNDYLELRSRQRHTTSALLTALERDPRCFSSSALLRPILQDSLLPTAAYVGGPAELGYFAQLPQLYAAYGLAPGMVAPRARLQLIEPSTARLLARWQLPASAVTADETALLGRLAERSPSEAGLPSADQLQARLQQGLEHALRTGLEGLPDDLTRELARELEKTRHNATRSVGKLARRYGRARLQRDQARVSDALRLRRQLFPEGAPQERVFGYSYFAARYGERAWLERVLSAIEPCLGTQASVELSL